MKNDFTDLHNEFSDNLKLINQQQLDEINVRGAVDKIGNISKSVGNKVGSISRTGKRIGKEVLQDKGERLSYSAKEKIKNSGSGKKLGLGGHLGRIITDPGSYAKEYDPEEMYKKGVNAAFRKTGNWLQSKTLGLYARAKNLLFARTERAYYEMKKRSYKQQITDIREAQTSLRFLKTLTPQMMIQEMNSAFVEYLAEKRYSSFLGTGNEKEKDKSISKTPEELAKGAKERLEKEEKPGGKKRTHPVVDEKPTIIDPSTGDKVSSDERSGLVLGADGKKMLRNSFDDYFDDFLLDFLAEASPAGPSRANTELEDDKLKEIARGIITKSSGNLISAIESFILKVDGNKIDGNAKKLLPYHVMLFCVAKVFQKRLSRSIFRTNKNPALFITKESLAEYDKGRETDPSVFYPKWFIYLRNSNRTFQHRNKLASMEPPTIKEMQAFAMKLRNFKVIAQDINYDSIKSSMDLKIANLKTQQGKLDTDSTLNPHDTVAQKIDKKIELFRREAMAKKILMNRSRHDFASLEDEEKEKNYKKFETTYKNTQNEYNKNIKDIHKLKDMRSRLYNGEEIEPETIDDLENYEISSGEEDASKKKDDDTGEGKGPSMSDFRTLIDKIRGSAERSALDPGAVSDAQTMAPKIAAKGEANLEDLKAMIINAQQNTKKESHEFQMKDFDYLAEKFIQKENSPLLESMPMIRFRRNPREGTSKIVMVCGKNEFKKSLNKTINVAGKKVKDVMCLPKQLKSAKERLKDRKASIKRWRKIRVNAVTVEKMNRKKQETKKASRTLRK